MGDDLDFLNASIDSQAAFLKDFFEVARSGRGMGVVRLFRNEFDWITREIEVARGLIDPSETDPMVIRADHRQLERFLPQLRVLYKISAQYFPDVGRSDLPVGLLRLIDQLVEDLLPEGGDRLIHLDPERMYATIPLAAPSGPTYPAPYPIIFHLPLLDPSNALLVPILAHEVGHSTMKRGARAELDALQVSRGVDQKVAKLLAKVGTKSATELIQLEEKLANWVNELFSDAVAAMLAGPSFLFASCSFLVASSWQPPSTHPQSRARIAMCLDILKENGWVPFLDSNVPRIHDWAKELAANQVNPTDASTKFLVEASGLMIPLIREVAKGRVNRPLLPAQSLARIIHAKDLLEANIPPVELPSGPGQTWETITAGWMAAIGSADSAASVASAPFNLGINSMLIKTIELSNVVEMWGKL